MTYDLTNLRKALSFTGSFEHGCLDCIGPPYTDNRGNQFSCRGPNTAEIHGIIRELQLLGLDLGEVDEAVRHAKVAEGGCATRFAKGHIGTCITAQHLYEVVESLLRSKTDAG